LAVTRFRELGRHHQKVGRFPAATLAQKLLKSDVLQANKHIFLQSAGPSISHIETTKATKPRESDLNSTNNSNLSSYNFPFPLGSRLIVVVLAIAAII
jgi:hypothetical protein